MFLWMISLKSGSNPSEAHCVITYRAYREPLELLHRIVYTKAALYKRPFSILPRSMNEMGSVSKQIHRAFLHRLASMSGITPGNVYFVERYTCPALGPIIDMPGKAISIDEFSKTVLRLLFIYIYIYNAAIKIVHSVQSIFILDRREKKNAVLKECMYIPLLYS